MIGCLLGSILKFGLVWFWFQFGAFVYLFCFVLFFEGWVVGSLLFGLVRFGLVWFGLVWFGLVWFGFLDTEFRAVDLAVLELAL